MANFSLLGAQAQVNTRVVKRKPQSSKGLGKESYLFVGKIRKHMISDGNFFSYFILNNPL